MSPPCVRCKAASTVHMPNTPRCTACFRHYLNRSFKTSLGRLGAGGRPTSLAIALSGGPSSAATACLFSTYVASLVPNPHAPPPRLILIHISSSETIRTPPVITELLSRLPHARLVTDCVTPKVASCVSKISDISDRRALERAVVLQALVDAARTEGCNTLLLGSSASRAATDVLHAIATARGATVQEVAAASTAVRDVKVLRPLRDIALRLIVRYARLEMPDVDWSYREQLHISRDMYGLVERFVGEVGVDNSASVHNVVRTADKLLDGREVRCMVCGGRGGLVSAECNKEQVCACRSESAICLSCRDCEQRAGKDKVNPILTLLQVRKEEERQRAGREQMRKQIADFIL